MNNKLKRLLFGELNMEKRHNHMRFYARFYLWSSQVIGKILILIAILVLISRIWIINNDLIFAGIGFLGLGGLSGLVGYVMNAFILAFVETDENFIAWMDGTLNQE